MSTPLTYTLAETCRVLKMAREPVLRRVYAGQLDGMQVNGRWLLMRESVEAFQARQAAAAAPPAPPAE